MKKNIIHFAAAGIMAVSAIACSKELGNGTADNQTVAMEPIVLQASSQTKTQIGTISGTSADIYWSEGDAISILSTDKGGNIELTASDIKGNQATFAGDVVAGTTTFAAVYPYSSTADFNSGSITGFAIPTTQTATAGSFANGAALAMATGTKTPGKPEVTGLQFKNLCSVIGFTFPSNITFANEVTITAKNNGEIAGAVTIDYDNAKITAATAKSVTIKPSSGNFEGGKTYYVTIAPGTYTGGFNFSIKTAGGSTYTRETTKELSAAAGGIYPLGTLSLILGTSDFTSSVTLTNTFSNGELSGTDAKLTITPKSEIAGTIKSYKYSVEFKTGTTIYRSLTDATATPTDVKLTPESGKPYIPSGSYSYTVTLKYTTNNGNKDVERGPITLTGNVSQSSPTGLNIQANLTGYTSYSCYKGTDGQSASANTANSKDNATIYGIGATYTKGVAAAVRTQCSNLWSFGGSKLDGGAKTGDASGQTWAEHTISADWSFDGTEGTLSKKIYVTGLPYNGTSFSSDGDNAKDSNGKSWNRKGANNKVSDGALQCGGTTGTNTTLAWESNFSFYVPEDDINVKLYCPNTVIHTYTGANIPTFTAKIAGTQVLSEKGTSSWYSDKTVSPSGNGTITSSNSKLYVASDKWGAGPYVRVYTVQLLYR